MFLDLPRSSSTWAVVCVGKFCSSRYAICCVPFVDNNGMAGFAGSGVSRAVFAFSLCSLDCRQALGFFVVAIHRCSSWTRCLCLCVLVSRSRQYILSGGSAVAALLQGR